MNNPTKLYKIQHPNRMQVQFEMSALDDIIPQNHRARDVWNFVQGMDCYPCFYNLKTISNSSGRPATSPLVLFALWIYSIMDGNSSARKLEELCENHSAYKWIAGGVSINRTMLAEFRSKDPMKFEDLLTSCLAAMLKHGVIDDIEFSQDGTRVKANAGGNSYRRKETLEELKRNLTEHICQLDIEAKTIEDAYEKKKRIREKRLAKEKMERIEKALEELEKAKSEKEENGARRRQKSTEEQLNKVRASVTDPCARRMKMGDGGFRLAYNIQFATGMNSRVIYGVDVVIQDPGAAPGLIAKVNAKLTKLGLSTAKYWQGDAAYSSKEDVKHSQALSWAEILCATQSSQGGRS